MPEDNVVKFPRPEDDDVPPQEVIAKLDSLKLETVIVIGETEDGTHCYVTSIANRADVLWLLEHTKMIVLEQARDD